MAKKRPLVVSFRRIQKMPPNNMENNCGASVSICDIHRIDTKLNDSNDVTTMKGGLSKHSSNPLRITMQKKSQSCRNVPSNDKQKFQLDSLYDESFSDLNLPDKGCVFPKEKFYGNAKLLLTMNNGISRKTIIDCDKDSHDQMTAMKYKIHHDFDSALNLTDNDFRYTIGLPSKLIPVKGIHHAIKLAHTSNSKISGVERKHKENEEKEEFSLDRIEMVQRLNSEMPKMRHNQRSKNMVGDETGNKGLEKSLSAPSVCALQKLKAFEQNELEQMESCEAFKEIQKSVSSLHRQGSKWKIKSFEKLDFRKA